jgi:tryptophan synthase alpha chain
VNAAPEGTTESRVETLIAQRNSDSSGALVGYLPVGFPDLPTSIDAAVALAENGVDVIEFGLPYSDPVMDGPVIQRATQTALAAGFRLRHGFEAVRAVRARVDVPILLMTYWNPVLQFGVERFATELAAAGGAGLITPDLIPDEAAQWIATS